MVYSPEKKLSHFLVFSQGEYLIHNSDTIESSELSEFQENKAR